MLQSGRVSNSAEVISEEQLTPSPLTAGDLSAKSRKAIIPVEHEHIIPMDVVVKSAEREESAKEKNDSK